MQLIQKTTKFQVPGETVITLGKFDGLHRGHQLLLQRVLTLGKTGLTSVVFSFDTPPNTVLYKEQKQMLLTNEERLELLEETGLDYFIECPFVPEISGMEPEDFLRDVLIGQLHARYIIVGRDFHFGHNRRGDYHLLQDFEEQYGYKTEVIEKAKWNHRDISSSYVKEMLLKGEMEEVKEMLGYPYYISGEIVHGRRIGHTIGIPTINLIPLKEKLLPPYGVYTSRIKIKDTWYTGVTNIGINPTIDDGVSKTVETHLFDCNEDLYGEEARVYLHEFQRKEMKFRSLEELKEQMKRDISCGKEYFDE